MHELSLAQRILEIALDAAKKHGATSVSAVRLRVGQLSGVEVETLRFGFEVLARETIASGCSLDVTAVSAILACRACGEQANRELFDPCPACGALGGEVVQGREFQVESIDIDGGPTSQASPSSVGNTGGP